MLSKDDCSRGVCLSDADSSTKNLSTNDKKHWTAQKLIRADSIKINAMRQKLVQERPSSVIVNSISSEVPKLLIPGTNTCDKPGCVGQFYCLGGCIRKDQETNETMVGILHGSKIDDWLKKSTDIPMRERAYARILSYDVKDALKKTYSFQKLNTFAFAVHSHHFYTGCYPDLKPGAQPLIDGFRVRGAGDYRSGYPICWNYSIDWRAQQAKIGHERIISGLRFVPAERVPSFAARFYSKYCVEEQEVQVRRVLRDTGLKDADAIQMVLRHLLFPEFRKKFDRIYRPMMLAPSFGYTCALKSVYGWYDLDCEPFLKEVDDIGVFPCNRDEVTIDKRPSGWGVERTLWVWWMLDICEMKDEYTRLPFYSFTKLCGVRSSRIYQPMCVFKRMEGPSLERLLKFCVRVTQSLDKVACLDAVNEFINIDERNTSDPRWCGDMDVVAVNDKVDENPAADPQGDVGLQEDQELNTEITGGTKDIEAEFIEKEPSASVTDSNVEDRAADVPVLTTRWGEVANFSMNTTTVQGAILARVSLPDAALRALDNTPIALSFKQYEYCIPKMKVKIITNCSKQQLACAGSAFVYGYAERDRVEALENLATLSTMPNVIMNGSFSTSTIIDIPYMHPLPIMPIVSNNWAPHLTLGSLIVYCIVPVNVAAGNPGTINYRIFVSLEGTKFYGQRGFYVPYVPTPCIPVTMRGDMLSVKKAGIAMLANNVLKPLMQEVDRKTKSAVKGIENELISLFDDVNRDAPTTSKRGVLFQTTTVDMPAGVGPKFMNTMRLNPLGTTQHHESDVGLDLKFDLDALKQCFGLEAIVNWTTTQVARQRLFETRVQLSMNTKSTFGNVLTGNTATPADNLATMFQTSRGKIEYKIIFITTGFHTGRIRLTYEPGVARTSTCDLDAVPYAVVDLGSEMDKTNSVSFMVPYQIPLHQLLLQHATSPYGVNSATKAQYWSGNFSIFVENPLVAPSTVGSQVSMLVYKRVVPQFEFGIPRNNLDMFEVGTEPPSMEFAIAYVFFSPVDLLTNTFQMTSAGQGVVNVTTAIPSWGSGNALQFNFIPSLAFNLDFGPVLIGSVFFQAWFSAANTIFCRVLIQDRTWQYIELTGSMRGILEIGGWFTGPAISWSVTSSTITIPAGVVPTVPVTIVAPPYMQGDMLVGGEDFRFQGASTAIDLFPTGPQMLALENGGEKHDNLKDILRRFELWWSTNLSVDGVVPLPNAWHMRIPVSFGSPIQRTQTIAEFLWMRSNKITKISDMFRYVRGSVRWVISVSSDTPGALSDTIMEVVHVPNVRVNFNNNSMIGLFAARLDGYAVQSFSLKQNNVVPIEFPHYNLGRMAWNSSYLFDAPFVNTQSMLGLCYIRFTGPSSRLNVKIHRALGDDAHFFVFNGCPNRFTPVAFDTVYNTTRPAPVALVEEPSLLLDGDIESNPGPILSKYVGDGLFQNVDDMCSEIQYTSKFIQDMCTSQKRMADRGAELCDMAKDFISRDERLLKYTDIVLQVLQVIVNPTLTTFTLSMTSILLKMIPAKMVTFSVNKISELCKSIWNMTFNSSYRPDYDQASTENVWTCLCEFFNIKTTDRDPIAKRLGALFRMASLSEKMFGFIEAVIEGVKVALNRLYAIMFPGEVFFKVVTSEAVSSLIKEFVLAAGELTNPLFESGILSSKDNTKYLFNMYEYGELLKVNLPKLKIHQRDLYRQLIDAHRDLKKLCQKSVQSANKPLVRMEPFVLHIAGEPGIGKSFETDEIICDLIKSMDVKVIGDPIHTKSPATKFMDGWTDNKLVLKYDDFNAINEAEPESLSELIHLKSSAVYIGNFADTVDKQRCVHPRLIVLCSNEIMPKHNDVKEIGAVLRRRDLLLKFELSAKFVFCTNCKNDSQKKGMGCSDCRKNNQDIIERDEHIMVTSLNPMTSAAYNNSCNRHFLGAWRTKIVETFKEFQEGEMKRYQTRLERIEALINSTVTRPWDSLVSGQPNLVMKERFARDLVAVLGENVSIKNDNNLWRIYALGKEMANYSEPIDLLIGAGPSRPLTMNMMNLAKGPSEVMQEEIDTNVATHEANSLRTFGAMVGFGALAATAVTKFRQHKRASKVKNPCLCSLLGLRRTIQEQVQRSRALKVEYENREYIYDSEDSDITHRVKEYNASRLAGKKTSLFAEYEPSVGAIRLENGLFELECEKCVKKRHAFRLKLEGWDPEEIPCICELEHIKYDEVLVCGRFVKINGILHWSTCMKCVDDITRSAKLMALGIPIDDMVNPDLIEYGLAIGVALRYASGLYIALRIIKSLYSWWATSTTGDADSSYEPRKGGQVKAHKNTASKARSMRHDSHLVDIQRIVSKNYYKIRAGINTTHILMVKGRMGLITSHFWHLIKEDDEIEVEAHGQSFFMRKGDIDARQLRSEDEQGILRCIDLMFLEIGKVPSARDIVQHFMSIESLDNHSNYATFNNVRTGEHVMALPIKTTEILVKYSCPANVPQVLVSGFSYNFADVGVNPNYEGACMSTLVDEIHGKILALHVASEFSNAWSKKGSAQLMTSDLLVQLMGDSPAQKDSTPEGLSSVLSIPDNLRDKVEFLPIDDDVMALPHYVTPVAKVQVPVRHSVKTDIRRSPLYGILSEPIKRPVNFLTDGELKPGIDKMAIAIAGNEPKVDWPTQELRYASQEICNEICAIFVPASVVCGMRTLNEVILGVESVTNMPPMDLNTSAGFPLNYRFGSKKGLIEIEEVKGRRIARVDPDLNEQHQRYMLLRAQGEVPPTIFHCVLKDERRKEEKRDKPRLIQAGPVEHTIASRRLTMDFTRTFYDSKLKSFSAVGVDCLGPDWSRMVEKLRWKDNIICGDVKNFGPTLPHELVAQVYWIINKWYEVHDPDKKGHRGRKTMRNAILGEVINSTNVAYDTIFQTQCCSPSGQPLTVVVNTISMAIYIFMAYREIMVNTKLRGWLDFKENVDMLVYGDDIWISVSPKIADKFNNLTLSEVFIKHGVSYTDIDKKEVVRPFTSFRNSSFLGRTPMLLNGFEVGALELNMIKDIVNWTKCKSEKNLDDHMLSTTHGVLIEAMFYGEREHKHIFKKLNDYWIQKGRQLTGFTYVDLYEKWRSKFDEFADICSRIFERDYKIGSGNSPPGIETELLLSLE